MGGKIRILPDTLINRIAAGEVVERPASVVKELLENAVDAGARDIRVEVFHSGGSLILVADNGRGMDREDLLLAVERHATSKIREYDDLVRLRSMGFRGEALPSIAAVSRMTIRSVPEGEVAGHRLEIWGGKRVGLEEIAGTPGTVVEVRDLFYNTPARKAFLKSPRVEWHQIQTALERVALGFPEIRFDLLHNGKRVLTLFATDDFFTRLSELWGPDRTRELIPVEYDEGGFKVWGWISPPHLHHNQSRHLAFVVNRRWVRSPLLYPLVLRAYAGMIPAGRFPTAVLWMEVPPEWVDVNIHPFKQEVRFSENAGILHGVGRALNQALRAHAPQKGGEGYRPPFEGGLSKKEGPPLFLFKEAAPPFTPFPAGEEIHEAGRPKQAEEVPSLAQEGFPHNLEEAEGGGGFSGMSVLGQLQGTYIAALNRAGLVLIDQHAAHERVLYERYLKQWKSGGIESQYLLLPRLLEVPPGWTTGDPDLWRELQAFGFEAAPAGGNALWIKAVPSGMSPEEGEEVLKDLLRERREGDLPPNPEDQARSLLKLLACHSAVRAGETMGPEGIRALLQDLDRTEHPSHCPHGRPLWILLTWEEIEKRFRRK